MFKDFDDCTTAEALAQAADRGGTIRIRRSEARPSVFEVTITGRGVPITCESEDYDTAVSGALLREFARASRVIRLKPAYVAGPYIFVGFGEVLEYVRNNRDAVVRQFGTDGANSGMTPDELELLAAVRS